MSELPKAIEELKVAMELREPQGKKHHSILNKLWPACCNVVDTWESENRRTGPNEVLTVGDMHRDDYVWVVKKNKKPVMARVYSVDEKVIQFELFGGGWYCPKPSNIGSTYWLYRHKPEKHAVNTLSTAKG